MPANKQTGEGKPLWSWRRVVVLPLIVYACYRLSMLENAPDTRVNEDIVWWWGVIIISNTFFYTGFATIQDITAIIATRSGLPYATPQQTYQTQTTTVTPTVATSTVTTPVTEPVLDEPAPGAKP